MAYRRGARGAVSKVRQTKQKRREERKIRNALENIEYAKQDEARKRSSMQGGGLTLGTIIGGILAAGSAAATGGWSAAAMAAWMAGGKAAGDVAYHSGSGNIWGQGGAKYNEIERAVQALELLEEESKFAESRDVIESEALKGYMASEDIAGGDWETGGVQGATDFLQYWMTLSGIQKGITGATETVTKS